jgi:hypothetical protein
MKLEVPIEVKSVEVMQKTVRGNKDGKEYLIRSQTGWADLGKDYPQEIQIPLGAGQEPYPQGKHRLDPACLYIDRFGNLSLGRARLLPVK